MEKDKINQTVEETKEENTGQDVSFNLDSLNDILYSNENKIKSTKEKTEEIVEKTNQVNTLLESLGEEAQQKFKDEFTELEDTKKEEQAVIEDLDSLLLKNEDIKDKITEKQIKEDESTQNQKTKEEKQIEKKEDKEVEELGQETNEVVKKLNDIMKKLNDIMKKLDNIENKLNNLIESISNKLGIPVVNEKDVNIEELQEEEQTKKVQQNNQTKPKLR